MEIKQFLLDIKQLQSSGRYKDKLRALKKIESALESFEDSSLEERDQIELQLLHSSLKRWNISPIPANQIEQQIKHDKKLVEQTKKLGNQNLYAEAVFELLINLWKFGYYEEGLKLVSQEERTLDTLEDLGTKARFLDIIGNIYHSKGQLDTALDYYKECLNIRISLGNQIESLSKAVSLNHIGGIYLEKGDTKTAEEYLRKSLEILKKLDYPLQYVYFLGTMIDILLRSKNLLEAKEFLKEQKSIADKFTDNQHFMTAHQLSQALIFKSSNRMRDKMQAGEIFAQIVYAKAYDFQFVVQAIPHYCELLFIEIKSLEDQEAFIEVKKVINRLQKIGTDQQSFSIIIKALILKAKLAVIEGQFDIVSELFEQALDIANTNQLAQLRLEIETEKRVFENEMHKWKDLVDSNATMYERIEQTKILDYIKKAQDYVR